MRKSYGLLLGTQALVAAELASLESEAPAPTEAAWRSGQLAYKLYPHQRAVYDRYRQWEREPVDDGPGEMRRIFVADIGRRWGKTFLVLLIKFEDALRHPGSRHTYATAFAKDVADILIPLADDICEDAPDDVRPRFQSTKQGESMGYYFPNGSSIKLVGVDLHPRGLRGRGSDGMAFTEAGYVRNLGTTIKRVVYPQFQQRPHARLILESNAPEEIDHDFDALFVPDAKERGAYVFGTIEDNQALSESEREEFIRAMGGRENPACQREYFGIRLRDPESTAVPEYDEQRHVGRADRPEYALTFVFQDPGIRDLFGIVWGYWHFAEEMLVIERSWAERNAGTAKVADVIASTNEALWGGDHPLKWWDGPVERQNPALNVSDIDARLIHDLNSEYDMRVRPADKSKQAHGVGEAKLYKLRNAFLEAPKPRILISPDDPGPLRDHLRKAAWNDNRTDLQRHPVYGHFDCMMALVYGWVAIQRYRNINPNKPAIHSIHDRDRVFGPKYVPPRTRQETLNAALQMGVGRAMRGQKSRCPVCGKHRHCPVFMNGQYVCSQECYNAWVYRHTGGKPPQEQAG